MLEEKLSKTKTLSESLLGRQPIFIVVFFSANLYVL
jgi:hypothetical protein